MTILALDDYREQKKVRQRVPKDSKSQKPKPFRPTLKLRLGPDSADVMGKIEEWKTAKKAAPTIEWAIRLAYAVLSQDTAEIARLSPFLAGLIQSPSPKKSAPPLKESSFKESKESDSKKGEMKTALVSITKIDPAIKKNDRDLDRAAAELLTAGYTPDQISLWEITFWKKYWKGLKGEAPTLKDIRELIGQVKTLAPLPPDQHTTDEDNNPFVKEIRKRLENPDDYEPELELDPEQGLPPRQLEPVGNGLQMRFNASLQQLQVQLNKATFDMWLRGAKAIGTRDDNLIVEVPSEYAKSWIDRHLLANWQSAFERIRLSSLPKKMVIVVRGDDAYRQPPITPPATPPVAPKPKADPPAPPPDPKPLDGPNAWKTMLQALRMKLSDNDMTAWLERLKLIRVDETPTSAHFVARAPTPAGKRMVEERFLSQIIDALKRITHREITLEILSAT